VAAKRTELFRIVKANSLELVQPSLVAIYDEKAEPQIRTEQIGTGFLVRCGGRPVVVTAKHVLYGHLYDEDPAEKAVFVEGSLKKLAQLNSIQFIKAKEHDLTLFYANEFDLQRCLPPSVFEPAGYELAMVTIHGFLARDFRRDRRTGILKPAPRMYTNIRVDLGEGYVALRYPKSRNRSTDTGTKVMAARPSGMSGCPMLDTLGLAERVVRVAGVFTDYRRWCGRAFGEASWKVLSMLTRM
jgi:hypothetical protein